MYKQKSKNTKKNILFYIVIILFCAYLIVPTYKICFEVIDGRKELCELKKVSEQTQIEINQLNNMIENSTEDEVIEKIIRERLGYVYPNEQVYIDICDN